MDSESNKSDAEEILSEFKKTHGIETTEETEVEQMEEALKTEAEPQAEPQVEAEPQAEPQVEAEPQVKELNHR